MQMKNQGLRYTGIPLLEELVASPGYPSYEDILKGPIAVIECIQDIPCNPCEVVCPNRAIVVGDPITNLPVFFGERCDACGICIAACPGQAIFRVDTTYSQEMATVSFPYEYIPMPSEGDCVEAVNHAGEGVCEARVVRIQQPKRFDHTAVVTVVVPKELAMVVRSMKQLTSK